MIFIKYNRSGIFDLNLLYSPLEQFEVFNVLQISDFLILKLWAFGVTIPNVLYFFLLIFLINFMLSVFVYRKNSIIPLNWRYVKFAKFGFIKLKDNNFKKVLKIKNHFCDIATSLSVAVVTVTKKFENVTQQVVATHPPGIDWVWWGKAAVVTVVVVGATAGACYTGYCFYCWYTAPSVVTAAVAAAGAQTQHKVLENSTPQLTQTYENCVNILPTRPVLEVTQQISTNVMSNVSSVEAEMAIKTADAANTLTSFYEKYKEVVPPRIGLCDTFCGAVQQIANNLGPVSTGEVRNDLILTKLTKLYPYIFQVVQKQIPGFPRGYINFSTMFNKIKFEQSFFTFWDYTLKLRQLAGTEDMANSILIPVLRYKVIKNPAYSRPSVQSVYEISSLDFFFSKLLYWGPTLLLVSVFAIFLSFLKIFIFSNLIRKV